MNKITIGKTLYTELDSSIKATKENKKLTITVLKNTSLIIDINNDFNIDIIVKPNITFNLTEIKAQGHYKTEYTYDINKNSTLNIVKINDVDTITEKNVFNLNEKDTKLNFILKTISTNEEIYDIIVNHKNSYSFSHIINQGVNIQNGVLTFDVTSVIPKGKIKCETTQTNRIINLTNNKCIIKPNLLIDENDIIANHSAHIGKCKDEEMFYLQSRGINYENAQKLIIKGFLSKHVDYDLIKDLIEKYWK